MNSVFQMSVPMILKSEPSVDNVTPTRKKKHGVTLSDFVFCLYSFKLMTYEKSNFWVAYHSEVAFCEIFFKTNLLIDN